MLLQSNRLIFTRFTEADYEDYKKMSMDYEIMKYISGKALTEEEIKERFEKIKKLNAVDDVLGFFSVKRKEDGKVLGNAKLVYYLDDGKEKGLAEVGYSLFPEFWGNGYATEITEYLTNFARGIDNIKEVIGIIDPENAASKKILTKCGYSLYESGFYNGKLPSEWYKIKLK